MGRHVYIKPEPTDVRGTCVKCLVNPQKIASKGRYKALCNSCNRSEYGRYSYRQSKGVVCGRCGFVPEHPCQLDVDHIDGNHLNSSKSNLQTLCANCHRLKTFENLDWNKRMEADASICISGGI